ncbi:MAG: hypothetical protein K2L78_04525, partial [Muribaculaceae bacterium]|nr:hypothetical protein [Muribaculaceae bacterium]
KGAVTEIGVINGEVLRFDITTPGIVRVLMRHSRTLYLSYRVTGSGSATWQFHGSMPEFPALAIVSADETNLSESFGAMNLSGAGGTHGTLSPADEKTVSDRVKSAYFRLKNRAAAMGLFLQPTLARYRLVDASGDTLAVSPPVMAGASGGFQCGNELRLTSTDNLATLQGGTITARAYRVSLKGFTTMPHPWRRMVKSVVVEALPQIDPVDADGLCPSSISTNGSATTVTVRPAGYSATAASNTIRQRNLIIKNLAQADAEYLIQGTFPNPFDTVPTETRVGLRDDAPAPSERIPACRPRRDDASFGASLLTGDELLLADRRQEGFKGYPPASYAATTGHGTDASCAAAVCVRTGTPDGNEATIVATSEGSAADITSFSPLLVFPDATATSLTIIMTRGEQVLTETYPLTPVAGSGLAYYLSPDLLPLFPRATAS